MSIELKMGFKTVLYFLKKLVLIKIKLLNKNNYYQ